MTNELRDFLNKNRVLLEEDKIEELIAACSGYSSYFTELVELLNECGTFEDYDIFRSKFEARLTSGAAKIESKYNVAGFTPILSTSRYSDPTVCTIDAIKNEKTNTLTIILQPDGAIPSWLPSGWEFHIEIDSYTSKIYLSDGANTSASYRISPPHVSFNFVSIMRPDVMKTHLDTFLSKYESFCSEIADACENCKKSFEYIETAKTYAEDIASELKIRSSEYFEIEPVVKKLENGFIVDTGLKNTKDNIYVIVPFDTDPSLLDVESNIKGCVAKIRRLKKHQDRSAQQAAEVAAQRPENYREITRRDITSCLKELGISANGIWYTNKHPQITTYKCAMCIVSEDDCKRIENKLRSMGADVESVTCKVGGTGWRSYPSLFIKIRN